MSVTFFLIIYIAGCLAALLLGFMAGCKFGFDVGLGELEGVMIRMLNAGIITFNEDRAEQLETVEFRNFF